MARTLVLGVDRDDDFGRKLGLKTPLVGRSAHLEAATRMLLVDPEESDANGMFAALAEHDALEAKGESVEVATVCGAGALGTEADRKIAFELDRVLDQVKPERCIVVTDGAEDESVMPVVTSRVKVDGVRRVVVRQHAGLEHTYYLLSRALDDPKVLRLFVFPVALALVVFGAFALAGFPSQGLGALALVLGVSYLWKSFREGFGHRGR